MHMCFTTETPMSKRLSQKKKDILHNNFGIYIFRIPYGILLSHEVSCLHLTLFQDDYQPRHLLHILSKNTASLLNLDLETRNFLREKENSAATILYREITHPVNSSGSSNPA